jgi:hypothetical protein
MVGWLMNWEGFNRKRSWTNWGTGELYILVYNAVWSVENQPTFRRDMSLLFSGSRNKPSKKPAWKEAASRAKQRATWRYIPEARTLHNHRCENLKSYITVVLSEHLLAGTEESHTHTHTQRTQHDRCSSKDSIWAPPEFSEPNIFLLRMSP